MAGDIEGYREHCQEMLEQFPDADRPDVADIVCKAAMLQPNTVEVDQLPFKQLRDGTRDPEWDSYRPYFIACCALVSYREGKHKDAIGWANQAGTWGPPGTLALLVRAMSEHQLEQTESALTTLAEAESTIHIDLRTLGTGDWSGTLPGDASGVSIDWQIAEILRREATALIRE